MNPSRAAGGWPWRRVRVTGQSMTPTLLDGDVLWMRFGGPIRQKQVVLARFRCQTEPRVLKRAVRPAAAGWWLASDNPRAGVDSDSLGVADVQARAVWLWRMGPGRSLRRGLRWWPVRLPAAPIDSGT